MRWHLRGRATLPTYSGLSVATGAAPAPGCGAACCTAGLACCHTQITYTEARDEPDRSVMHSWKEVGTSQGVEAQTVPARVLLTSSHDGADMLLSERWLWSNTSDAPPRPAPWTPVPRCAGSWREQSSPTRHRETAQHAASVKGHRSPGSSQRSGGSPWARGSGTGPRKA
jgi:hypothetical protein